MMTPKKTLLAIVDYNLGNLFSIKNACDQVGLNSLISSKKDEILAADAVLLPGMGAYGDAMETLHKLDLVTVLQDIAASGRPFFGICLGIQLLLSESCEFGAHKGLGIIEGSVVPLNDPHEGERKLKVPQIGWNQIREEKSWKNTHLENVPDGEYMYFVHSFVPQPQNKEDILATTEYGGDRFCSSIQRGNIYACLFHPERSSTKGIGIYRNIAHLVDLSVEHN